jgi:uncharacterized delta-60 repeat protein
MKLHVNALTGLGLGRWSHWSDWLRLTLTLTSAMALVEFPAGSAIQPAWLSRYNGGLNRGTNQAVTMALDAQGNIVVAGSSTGAAGDYDYLMLKYAPDGKQLWVARHASLNNGDDQLRAMAMDQVGNVHVTGTSGTLQYTSTGTLNWTAPFAGRDVAVAGDGSVYVTGFSTTDFATAKITPDGSNVWVRTTDLWGRGLDDRSDKVVVDEANDIYVGGGGLWASVPPFTYASFGVVKYNSSGDTVWVSQFPPEYGMHFTEVTALVTLDRQVYFSGKSTGGAGRTFYLTRLSSEGGADWTPDFSIGEGHPGAAAMSVTPGGETYLAGGRIWNGIPNVAYVVFKVATNGDQVWQAIYNNGNLPGYHRANAMALDTQGHIFVTGQSQNANGDQDWATIKYGPDGKEQWSRREDGPAHGFDEATAIAVDESGSVYVAGSQTKTNGLVELVLIKYSELENIRLQPDNHVALQFFETPGQVCRFQATTNFPNWSDLGSSVAGSDGIVHFTDTNAPAYPHRFYRFVAP